MREVYQIRYRNQGERKEPGGLRPDPDSCRIHAALRKLKLPLACAAQRLTVPRPPKGNTTGGEVKTDADGEDRKDFPMSEDATYRLMVAIVAAGMLANTTTNQTGPNSEPLTRRALDGEIAERAVEMAGAIDEMIEGELEEG